MLTCCPKCQHVLTSPAGSAAAAAAAAAGTSCTVAGLQLSMQEAADDVPAAAASGTAITVRVPGWTTGGGSVVLQAVPQGTGGLKVSTGEPSPSAPLSFVLPTTPTVILAGPAGQQWSFLVTPSPPPPTQPSPPPPPSIFNPLNPAFTANPSRLQSDLDLRTLTATQTALRTSGWYYEGLSWQESANLLLPTTAGTFLVRDSSDPRYLFSLSVQTDRGPTSTRLHYADGRFRFDAEPKIIPHMPLFDCVVKLVQHYTQLTANKSSASTTTSSANITTSNNHVTNFVANLNSQNKNFVADASKPRRKRSSAPRDQVWIDSAGQVHSHILLTSPLRQKDRFPSLMHLSRLAVNRLKVSTHIPIGGALPLSLQQYLGDYPYLC